MYIYDFVIEICIIFVFLITAWVFVIILYMPVDCTVLPLCVNTLVHIGDFYLDTKEISIQLTFRTQYQPENLVFNTCDAQDKYLNKAFNVSSYTNQHHPSVMVHHTIKDAVGVMIVCWLDLQRYVQSVPITTKVVSSNPVHGQVYSIQHYVIKFVSDLR
jgi:hypothetical protein